MRMKTLVISVILIMALSSIAMPQSLVRESFTYPATTLAGLGSAGNGFSGSWVNDEANGIEGLVSISGTRFAYADLNYEIPHDSLHLQVVKSNAWADHNRYKRPLAEVWPNEAGKKYWVSYMVDIKEPLPVGNTYFMVKLYKGTGELVAIGKGGGGPTPPVFTCGSGWPGETGDDVSATPIAAGPVWVVAMFKMSGTTDPARTYMWIDPDPAGAEPDTNDAIVKRNTSMSDGFDQIALEFGGDGADVRLVFDEITVASSFADLTAETPTGTVARESFIYPATSVAGLGSAGNGFSGPWVNDEANGIEGLVSISGTRFAYADLNYEIPHDSLHLQVVKSNAWADHNRYKRPLAEVWPNEAGKKYWVSYMVDIKEPLPVGNTYFMVKLYKGTGELVAIGKGGGGPTPPVFTCGSGWPGETGDDVSATPIAAGPVWVVAMFKMSGTTDPARTYMWIDPDPAGAEPDTNDAIVKRNTSMSDGFDQIALEFGGDGADVRLVFDEITIASSFDDLTKTAGISRKETILFDYSLSQNYPNPFNPTTSITYSLKQTGNVRLSVFDILGREVAVLVDDVQNAGQHTITFSGTDLSTGIYLYRLQVGREVITKKMVLVK
ncbi:MAG TPA: T9SS type A sorting domain-containing protein [Candidatus Marinimicrobia bacterium]|nr:T9SS type A sorting domain-containing protein [Candidatus Neomarinimicrobiota bacterium]